MRNDIPLGAMPTCIDAELSVIGSLIRFPEQRKAIFKIIPTADYLYDSAHRAIYRAIKALINEGLEPDLVMIANRQHQFGEQADMFSTQYLATVWDESFTTNALALARTVVDCYVRREAIRQVQEIQKKLLARNENTYSVLIDSSRQLSSLSYPLITEQQGEDVANTGYVPFPLDTLPVCLQEMIDLQAKALPVDPGMFVLPVLCTIAACIGSKRAIQLKAGWPEPCILWGCLIADSSSKKTIVSKKAAYPLWKIEADLLATNKLSEQVYQGKLNDWSSGNQGLRGELAITHAKLMPDPPPVLTAVVQDFTIESLYSVLADNPKGVICLQDELKSWLKSMGRYTSGGGSAEEAKWLEFHSGEPTTVHRKSTGRKGLHIPTRHVTLYGTIQPEIMARVMGQDQFDSGMMGRFLLAYPPYLVGEFTDDVVPEEVLDGYLDLCQKLYEDEAGKLDGICWKPSIVPLTAPAVRVWRTWYNEWQKHIASSDGELRIALRRLEGYAPRLALLLAVVEFKHASKRTCVCTESHMANAIKMVEWFETETIRVYRMMTQKPDARNRDNLVDLLKRHGGEISVRQLMRSNPVKFADVETAVKALDGLLKRGLGKWDEKKSTDKGGRPTKTFCLFT